MTNPMPLYPKDSLGYRWQRLGTILGLIAVVFTIYAVISAPHQKPAPQLLMSAVIWGVWPPFWWWFEFFFIFPKHYTSEKFEILKHGAQASLAIWAPIAVALAAYATSDHFKVPESPAKCTSAEKNS